MVTKRKMKKGLFSIAITALAIIILMYAVNQHNTNQEYEKTYAIAATAHNFEAKTNNLTRLLDKALADAYNDEHASGNCNDTGQTKEKAEEYFQKLISGLNTEYKINCKTNKQDISVGFPNLQANLQIDCNYAQGDIKITRILNLKLEKRAEDSGGTCLINDVVSGCQEYPAFDCP